MPLILTLTSTVALSLASAINRTLYSGLLVFVFLESSDAVAVPALRHCGVRTRVGVMVKVKVMIIRAEVVGVMVTVKVVVIRAEVGLGVTGPGLVYVLSSVTREIPPAFPLHVVIQLFFLP